MTSIVTNAGAMGDHAHGSFQRDSEPEGGAPAPEAAPAEQPTAADGADLRLTIELDPQDGGFVYTTFDRRTGAVVRQYARDRLLQLSAAPDYAAGALIKTKA